MIVDSRGYMSDGKFDIRPPGAAPLFDSRSGKAAARKRWDKERENTERAIIAFASEKLGHDISYEDAVNFVVNMPQFIKSMEGHTAAAKFVSQKLDLLPGGGQDPQVDARQVHVNVYQLDRPGALQFADDLREAGKLALAAVVEAQIEDGEGPFNIKVPIE
jgi:hypothetical protein